MALVKRSSRWGTRLVVVGVGLGLELGAWGSMVRGQISERTMMHLFRRFQSVVLAGGVVLLGLVGCSKEKQADGYREKAREYFAAGDYERARLEYLNLGRLVGEDPEIVSRLGMILQDQGATFQAAPILLKAAQLDPDNAELKGRVAQIYLAGSDFSNSVVQAWSALDLDPGEEHAVLLLAEAPVRGEVELRERRSRLKTYAAKASGAAIHPVAEALLAQRAGEMDVAQAAVSRALELDAQSAPAHFLQAGFYESKSNLVEAERELKRAAELSPMRSIRRVRYAEFKLRHGQLEEGKRLLAELGEKVPDYLPVLLAQARVAVGEQKLDEALGYCNRLLERYPLHLDAALLRSQIRLQKGEAAKAVEELARLGELFGRVPSYGYQLAQAQLANREPNGAIATLEKLTTDYPGYTEAVMLLARLNLQQNRADQAIAALDRSITVQTNNWDLRLMQADAYASRRQYDRALGIFREFATANPQDARGPFLQGMTYRIQGKSLEARALMESALQVDPQFRAATAQLVELDVEAGNLGVAEKRAEGLVEQAPDLLAGRLLLARVQLARTNFSGAEVNLKEVIRQDSGATAAYLMLANLYREDKRLQSALEQAEASLKTNPSNVQGLMLKAILHTELDQYEKARDTYETLLTISPDFSAALNNLAYIHSEQLPDYDKAWKLAQRVRALLPDSAEAADTLGWVHFKRGEYPEALRLLTESSQKRPDQPEVQYHLGMVQYMMAEEGAARAALEKALQSGMEFIGKAEAERRLALLADMGGGADARRRLEEQVKQEPNDVLALARLADLQVAGGDLAGAQKSLEQLLKVNPNLPHALVTQAGLKFKEGERDAALQLVRRAREAAPNDSEIAWRGGQIALQARDVVLALSLLQQASSRSGSRADIDVDLAEVTYLAGRVDDAQKLAQKVVAAAPAEAVLNRAKELDWCIQAYRNPGEAAAKGEAALNAMLQRTSDWVPARMAMAGVLTQKGQVAESKKAYEGVLAQLPAFSPAIRELALLYAGPLKDDAKAYEMGVKARQAQPNDPLLAKSLGLVSMRRGDARYAKQLLEEAARGLPQDAEIQKALADLAER